MAILCVGTDRPEQGQGNIIGSASALVPGAAGDTTSVLYDERKVDNIILADGPAGLRLFPHFQTTKYGRLLNPGEVIDGKAAKLETDENIVDYYHYCTAVPIATSLAQSWNMDILNKVGQIVGKEMKEYGISSWFATQNIKMMMGIGETKYSESTSPMCIYAGNDIQMPGSQENVDDIINEFSKENSCITKGDLQFCVLNILRCILNLKKC